MKEVTKEEYEQFLSGSDVPLKSHLVTISDPVLVFYYPASDKEWTGQNHIAKIAEDRGTKRYYIKA